MKKSKKFLSMIMALVMIMTWFFQIGLTTSYAAGVERDQVKITDFKLLREEDNKPFNDSNLYTWSKIKMQMDWDASFYGNQLKEGDFFTFDIPKEFYINEQPTNLDFPLYAPDGVTVIANAKVTRNSPSGGKVTVTFTNYVEGREHVKGTVYLISTLRREEVQVGKPNTFRVSIGPTFKEVTVVVQKNKKMDHMLNKWTGSTLDTNENVDWVIRMNTAQQTGHGKPVLTDKLTADPGEDMTGIHYIKNSFVLEEYEQYELSSGDWSVRLLNKWYLPESDITFSNNDTEFSYSFLGHELSGHFYYLRYKSTYNKGLNLRNNVTLKTDKPFEQTVSYKFKTFSGGGTGSGDLKGKIQIIKVDSEDTNKGLAGAVFTVTKKSDNTTFNLTTGADGKVLSEVLTAGEYEVKEITPPAGYILNATPQTVTVKSDQPVQVTFKNDPIKRDIKVTKKWVGTPAASVEVILIADGVQKATQTITGAPWEYTFTGLRTHTPDGTEIQYTVDETPIAGYNKTIAGDMVNGFEITNTATPKINIDVEKKWLGKPGTSATIKLMANGVEQAEYTFTPATLTYTFAGLEKLDASGNEIQYTVEEVPVAGYQSVVSGTMASGFVVKNVELVNIPVEKQWVGDPAAEVKIFLKKDGALTGEELTLNDGNTWKDAFKNLPKCDAATDAEILYEIEEAPLAGYTVDIQRKDASDISRGFTVKNTKNSAPSTTRNILVQKKWLGQATNKVVVRLFAGTQEVAIKELNSANNWQHIFKNYPLKDASGQEIQYTVQEDEVPGYESVLSGDMNSGFVFTNVELIELPVEKQWVGGQESEVRVLLKMDGGFAIQELVLNEGNGWKGQFQHLRRYDLTTGNEIQYEVEEVAIPGYSVTINSKVGFGGFLIRNTKDTPTPTETIDIPVKKQWVGTPQASVTVRLKNNAGLPEQELILTAAMNWSGVFSKLPKRATTGSDIQYEVTEDPVENYTTRIEPRVAGDLTQGVLVTNTIVTPTPQPEIRNLEVEKEWIGINPADAPEIRVYLVKNGEETSDYVDLNEGNNWKASFENLPVTDAGTGAEIQYTVKELGEQSGEVELSGIRYRVSYDNGKVINEKINDEPTPPDNPTPPETPYDPTPLDPEEPWQPEPQQPKEPENPGIGGDNNPTEPPKPDNPTPGIGGDSPTEAPSDPTQPSETPDKTPPDADVEIDDGVVPKGTGDDSEKPQENEEEIADGATPKGTGDDTKLPKTGEKSGFVLHGLMLVIAGLGMLFLKRRKFAKR